MGGWGPGDGGGGGGDGGDGGGGDGGSSGGGGGGFDHGQGYNPFISSPWTFPSGTEFAPGFTLDYATRIRAAHGIICSFVFVIVFPLGAILLRLLRGRVAMWVHAIIQVIGLLGFGVGAGLGIYLIRNVEINDQSLFTIPQIGFHPIIGLIILAALAIQPVLGVMHHIRFRQEERRTAWSYAHIWNGRVAIVIGFVNGGLGLWIAGAPDGLKGAYAIVAGAMGALWLLAMLWGRIRRRRD